MATLTDGDSRGARAMDEQEIESAIVQTAPTAPRLKPEDIDAVIMSEQYHLFEGTTLTVCCLTLRNGFCVIGDSAPVSPENFNAEVGRQVARSEARNKIWQLEGYLLKQRIHDADVRRDLRGRHTQQEQTD